MKRISLFAFIATVVLTACAEKNTPAETPKEEKYTITFGKDEYKELSRHEAIFVTAEANMDFTIEKAEEVEKKKITQASNNGLEVKMENFSAQKIEGHNRLQIKINYQNEQEERNFTLYVKNGNERGKITFHQQAFNPDLIGEMGPILFDPVFYDIGANGGEIETAIAENVGVAPYIFKIDIAGGKSYMPSTSRPSFYEAKGILSVTVIDIKDNNNPELTTGTKLKLNVEPNNTGKDREIYVEVENVMTMSGYVIIYQSAK